MKKLITAILLIAAIGCSGSIDTSKFTPDEYFEYIKKLYDDGDYYDALQNLKSILIQYPSNAISDDAQYYLGLTYFQRSEYILAAYEFSKLIKDLPASPFVKDSQYMLAESYYQLSPPPALDQRYSKKAVEEFQAFIDFFPTDPKVEQAEAKINEINDKVALKEFNAAQIYEKMQYFIAAIKAYDYVSRVHHDSKYAKEALYRKIILEADKKNYEDLTKDIDLYISRYNNDEKISELQKLKEKLQNRF